MGRFRYYSRDEAFLLPPDMREWVPSDDLSHFVIEACERVDLCEFDIPSSNAGIKAYHPQMMLALLVYSYATGIFSSRKIERATYRDIGVRYVAAGQHPDHNTIALFRRRNGKAIKAAFLHIVHLARQIGMVKVGTVSIDGTKIKANASKLKCVRYDRAKALSAALETEIAGLLDKAEQADQEKIDDPKLPKELARRQALKDKLDKAVAHLEAEALEAEEAAHPAYESKKSLWDEKAVKHQQRGKAPKAPDPLPKDTQIINLSDYDAKLMRKSKNDSYFQTYNGQAVVDADGSQLILATDVLQTPSDQPGFVQIMDTLSEEVEIPVTVLADAGYGDGEAVEKLKAKGIKPLVAITGGSPQRPFDLRPPPQTPQKPPRALNAQWRKDMLETLKEPDNKAEYRKRKQTVEPVFGIIKSVLGFTHFLTRGLENVKTEWNLIATAYNIKRLHPLIQNG